ncbi:MAG: hypothetical protein I8H76_11055 [Burkholderiales bacterium]|nr:hypothetical protein [Burkholderiales bacterium]MBH2016376.1 hypothetical protein [Burkholderiales bacterium]
MITYSSPKFWQRTWFTLACMAVAALAVVGWWWLAHSGAPSASMASAGQLGPDGSVAATAATSASRRDGGWTAPTVLGDGRPSDFSPQEWSALKDAMAQTAQPEAELKRVVAYLRFQKHFERWQGLRESPDAGQRQQLAASLLDQVPERLRQGEVSMGEAQMLLSALWADVEPDESRRRQRIEEGITLLKEAAPRPDAEQQKRDAALLAEYKRREAAILLEYQSRPDAQRDPAWLEAQLDAARRSVYSAN